MNFMTRENLLRKLEEAKNHKISVNSPLVQIDPKVFYEMLRWGMNEGVRINASGGQPSRRNGYYAHSIDYNGTTYFTETRKEIIVEF